MTAADAIIGSAIGETLPGLGGADNVDGGSGGDALSGEGFVRLRCSGDGAARFADALNGGDDDDHFIIDEGKDRAVGGGDAGEARCDRTDVDKMRVDLENETATVAWNRVGLPTR